LTGTWAGLQFATVLQSAPLLPVHVKEAAYAGWAVTTPKASKDPVINAATDRRNRRVMETSRSAG
jgi:hypothetical protein